jgi:hypothetical protein
MLTIFAPLKTEIDNNDILRGGAVGSSLGS